MPGHGGKRPGSGRKPKIHRPSPLVITPENVLERMPAGQRNLHRRVVLALSFFGAEASFIAGVLEMKEAEVREFFADELEAGQLLVKANMVVSLYRAALGDGVPWSLTACRMFLRDWNFPVHSARVDRGGLERKTPGG